MNLCYYSEDIKDIFMQHNGVNVLLEYLLSKDEDILHHILRLLLALFLPTSRSGSAQSSSTPLLAQQLCTLPTFLPTLFCLLTDSDPLLSLSASRHHLLLLNVLYLMSKHSSQPKLYLFSNHEDILPTLFEGHASNPSLLTQVCSLMIEMLRDGEIEYKRLVG